MSLSRCYRIIPLKPGHKASWLRFRFLVPTPGPLFSPRTRINSERRPSLLRRSVLDWELKPTSSAFSQTSSVPVSEQAAFTHPERTCWWEQPLVARFTNSPARNGEFYLNNKRLSFNTETEKTWDGIKKRTIPAASASSSVSGTKSYIHTMPGAEDPLLPGVWPILVFVLWRGEGWSLHPPKSVCNTRSNYHCK